MVRIHIIQRTIVQSRSSPRKEARGPARSGGAVRSIRVALRSALLSGVYGMPEEPDVLERRQRQSMTDEIEVLLRYCENEWNKARHSEDQRATMTNFIVLIAAGILGLMGQLAFDTRSMPLALLLVLLGTYGAVSSAKLYERWRLHRTRARFWSRRLDELCPKAQIYRERQAAWRYHKSRHPRLARLRLHWLWVILHSLIAVLGLACAATTIILSRL